MRNLTNDYRDSQILNLSAGRERGPYLVTQSGVAPDDPAPRTHLFVLRPDGCWADFNAYACQGKPEVMDEIVFTSMADVTTTFGRLFGKPRVAKLSVDEAGLQAWIDKQKDHNPLEAAQAWAVQYRLRRSARS